MNDPHHNPTADWASLTYNERQIALFFETQRPSVMAYLSQHFPVLSTEDREDILQEASIRLWTQLTASASDVPQSSPSDSAPASGPQGFTSIGAYFCGICRICALEVVKQHRLDPVTLIDELPTEVDADEGMRRIGYLIRLDEEASGHDERISRRKAALVRQMVRSLPAPCNELLWSLYRDGLSMKALAKLYHYASEAVARVMSHNCRQKFARRYAEEVRKIY